MEETNNIQIGNTLLTIGKKAGQKLCNVEEAYLLNIYNELPAEVQVYLQNRVEGIELKLEELQLSKKEQWKRKVQRKLSKQTAGDTFIRPCIGWIENRNGDIV